MRPRGWLAAAIVALSPLVLAVPISAGATGPAVPDRTLTVDLPGTLSGCYYYSTSTSNTLRAILDLVRPSAFQNKANGDFIGSPGPVTQAELVSLDPQTVVYTLDTSYTWSNGAPFNGQDLQHWYQQARGQQTALADGYRSIGSLVVSPTLNQVTVTFATPYSSWPLLFRDMNERATQSECTLSSLVNQPSLGPYVLHSITSREAHLDANAAWPGQSPGYAHIIIRTGTSPTAITNSSHVDYRYAMSGEDLNRITNDGSLNAKIAMSNGIIAVDFSPVGLVSSQLAVRQFLGYAINRQVVDDQVLGATTYDAGLANSVILPQGILKYTGTDGVGPIDQVPPPISTTVPSTAGVDCVACAAPILTAAGYSRNTGVWRDSSGSPLTVRVAYGTASYDRETVEFVTGEWRAEGVEVSLIAEPSDLAVTHALSIGVADAGILTIDTALSPDLTARAWTGTPYVDTYDSGWRSALVDQWYAAAQANFNPVAALASYDLIDQYVTTQAWERPLFTQPSILTWSNDVYGVVTSNYLEGIVDQIPAWGYTPPKIK